MVTNKTDVVRFQRFAHHRRIWCNVIAWTPDYFKEFFLAWSHIVRAPAGVCIWKHRPMSGRAPYDGVVRSAGPRTLPGRFYTNFHVQWWIHLYRNSPSFLQRNRLWNKKDWGWLWQWWWWKPHLLKTAKKSKHLFVACKLSSAAQAKFTFLYLCFWS